MDEQTPTQSPVQSAREYAPTILGAVVVLALIIGGWYLWQNRTKTAKEEVVQEEIAATPSPTPAVDQTAPTSVTQLPEAGFPVPALAAASALLLAAGWKLHQNFKI